MTNKTIIETLENSYKKYFTSGMYDRRYPSPNLRTLGMITGHLKNNDLILDYGCGNGRYTIPVLKRSSVQIDVYDPCLEALDQLRKRAESHGLSDHIENVSFEEVFSETKRYNMIISLFGVLSHLDKKSKREGLLKKFYTILKDDGFLIISVPNSFRRFYWNQLVFSFKKRKDGDRASGDIIYRRRLVKKREKDSFFYHLYTVNNLLEEIKRAGFEPVCVTSESILPESIAVKNKLISFLDSSLSAVLPAFLGYGILLCARKKI